MNMEPLNRILSEIDKLKEELSKKRPLPKEALDKIQKALDIEYTYESNRIEGNTLTLQETALVVNEGITIGEKPLKEHLEAINHAEAISYVKDIAQDKFEIDGRLIKDIHSIILRGIDRDNAGKYRNVPVMISGSTHMPPQPYLIEPQTEAFIRTFHDMTKSKEHPVIIAAYLHDELVKIHPFIDGNGRTSRLLMNLYLLGKGYVIVNLKGDNRSKRRYYEALEKSHTQNDPLDFYTLVAENEKDALVRYLSLVG
ncbi:Fic family protein [Dysgonomonas sp. GY75]|uniref:Fic family protein n=1 Tax=Dysgonomonas sp. GY75 TaxID=2780419 RepID=UPI001883A8AD|nr:Fic family protein [Dysgonomonas sp. GY75]MBF0648742.1 Fic family protein [Dysgonomonas sp. GY75]